jgi:glycosyltransferase involved in cell wall biosynthesis
LRIAFVVDKCAPMFVGGYEVRTFALASELSKNHEVRVYTSARGSIRLSKTLSIVGLLAPTFLNQRTGERRLFHDIAFATALTSNPFVNWVPDVCIVESIPYLHLLSVRRWARHLPTKFVVDVHEAWSDSGYLRGKPLSPVSLLIRMGITSAMKYSQLVLAVSQATADSLNQSYGVNPNRIMMVPNGLQDSDLYGEGTFRRGADEARERRIDFVSIGRLVECKRHVDFVEALHVLRSAYNWRGQAMIVGDGNERRRLANLIRRYGLDSQIKLPGFLKAESKMTALRESRVFVLTSEREGFSIATLEAMAMGLPIVAARPQTDDVFGVRDLVTEGHNGLFYQCGDIRSLANRLKLTLESPSLRSRLGEAGRRRAEEFRWSRIATSLEARLATLLT